MLTAIADAAAMRRAIPDALDGAWQMLAPLLDEGRLATIESVAEPIAAMVAVATGCIALYSLAVLKPRHHARLRSIEQARVSELREVERQIQSISRLLLLRDRVDAPTGNALPAASQALGASVNAAVAELAARTTDRCRRAFALLSEGQAGEAEAIFEEVMRENAVQGRRALSEAAGAARNLAALRRLPSTM